MRNSIFLVLLLVPAYGLGDEPRKPNTLTPKEIRDGWILLFDAESTFGWNNDAVPAVHGTLQFEKNVAAATTSRFSYFELRLETKIEKGSAWLYLRGEDAIQRWNITGPGSGRWRPYAVKTEPTLGPVPISLEAGNLDVWHARDIKLRALKPSAIFNGKDLTGWKVFPGKKSKFTVEDGAITINNGPGDLQAEGKYKDFILQLECKSNGKHLNSGVFFRCREGEYQNGYEAQIRNQFTAEPKQVYTIEEYDPKTHELIAKKKVKYTAVDYGTGAIYRRQPARREVAKDGEWFTMTILAHGNHFATWVNGIQVTDWTDNRPPSDNARNGFRREGGHISFQGHDPTTNLSFRNIRIAELK